MSTKEVLQALIQNFSTENLIQLFRNKSNKFRLINENENQLNNEFFNKVLCFGEIKLDDDEELIIYTFITTKDLTERSGKKAQYELAKKILKQDQRYSAGFFIFYDVNSNFRLSLVYDTPLPNGKREWTNFRRFTYYVSKDQTNKTFINQIDSVKFTSLEKIKEAFSVEKVTKEFYKEIANWYFWTLKKVKFPDDAEAEKNGKEISVIRLITRLIFIWFMKVRKLVPEELFNENELKGILTDLKLNNDNYYKAILQNLFFATLNTKQEDRRFTSKKKGYKGFSQDFGNHNVYRYEELFKDSEEAIEKYLLPIPFLNGGLFECLDYKTKTRDERKYIDGFTETKSQQPVVPNILFFSEEKTIDLNKEYGTQNKKYIVRGLINTLSLYNFTIDESDPNDADVALDPELLGKVFENLLASYNPETAKTARKSTGSYYTPRPIVDYMVDESLKQYFKMHIDTAELDNKLNNLFSGEDYTNPFDAEQTKEFVNLIDSLRVVDPAVGSGAFPMRILNRLVFLLHKLDSDNTLWKQSQIEGIKKSVKDVTLQRKFIEETERKFKEKNPNYGRKLYLIEKCIYGVDIQQIAVEIAKLRFFISLLVDEKVENGEIEPLPNLDFKLMQGNSLISSFAGIDFTTKPQNDDNLFDFDEKYKQLIEEFEELKSQYQNEPVVKKKNELREKIDKKLLEVFEEKLKKHYPQINNLEGKYSGRKEIIEAEKKKLYKKIGIDLTQAEQDLIAYTEGRKQKDFFLWDVYFAEVFAEKDGFDVVIGNPPYGHSIKHNKRYFTDVYFCSEGKFEIFKFFIERGLSLLKAGGMLSYITSDTWTSLGYFKKLRKLIYEHYRIYAISKTLHNVFETATVDTNIYFIQYSQPSSKYFLIEGDLKSKKEKVFDIDDNYVFNLKDENSIIKKIEISKTTINDFCEVWQGLIAYGSKKQKRIYTSFKKETESHRKLLYGGDISKYTISWSGEYLKYGDWLHRPRPNYIFDNEKILVQRIRNPQLKIRLVCAIDEKKYINGTGSSNILLNDNLNQPSLKFLLALLNSKLLNYWFSYYFIDVNIKPEQLRKIPVKITPNENPFVHLVEEIILSKKSNPEADTKHLENQLDIMVYKLYNLTYEEVKIIDPFIDKIISEKEYEQFAI
ncbi:MAG: hypothetical protein D8M26_11030 [Ignavibacteriae bacterium]|nr:hypothetical protein [Ignavibacteriota bacterium]